MSRGERKEVENIIQVVSNGKIEAGELCRHSKRTEDCKQISDDTRDVELGGEGLEKATVKSESSSSASGAVL